jgi:uncharacterized peroxidase-related enzyme
MSWIKSIPFDEATGKLKKLYQKVTGPKNNVDNIMKVHSLRPHTMEGHMALYKNVLHHSANTFPKWYLEALGVYVSMLNSCEYCVSHHLAGLKRLIGEEKGGEIFKALQNDTVATQFDKKRSAGFEYAKLLTLTPTQLTNTHIEVLRNNQLSDGEILEINQVVSYFNYANRTVLGLGVVTEGDILGLSPNSAENSDWNHQ